MIMIIVTIIMRRRTLTIIAIRITKMTLSQGVEGEEEG